MLDAAACRAWWLRRLHPSGAACPACGVSIVGCRAETWSNDGRLRCAGCGKWFDNRTGTPLDTCRVDWKQLTIIASLFPAGVRPVLIGQICRVSDDTVRRIAKRLCLGIQRSCFGPTVERRFIVGSEGEEKQQISADMVKKMAGVDSLTVRVIPPEIQVPHHG